MNTPTGPSPCPHENAPRLDVDRDTQAWTASCPDCELSVHSSDLDNQIPATWVGPPDSWIEPIRQQLTTLEVPLAADGASLLLGLLVALLPEDAHLANAQLFTASQGREFGQLLDRMAVDHSLSAGDYLDAHGGSHDTPGCSPTLAIMRATNAITSELSLLMIPAHESDPAARFVLTALQCALLNLFIRTGQKACFARLRRACKECEWL